MIEGSKMMRPPSRIHHANKRNPLTDPAKSKSDSPVKLDANDFERLR
jgi:hypothetical protein